MVPRQSLQRGDAGRISPNMHAAMYRGMSETSVQRQIKPDGLRRAFPGRRAAWHKRVYARLRRPWRNCVLQPWDRCKLGVRKLESQ